MLPFWLRLQVPRPGRRPLRLFLPVILVWVILAALLLLLLPFLVLAALVTSGRGPGFRLLLLYPLLAATLANLSGLRIEAGDVRLLFC